MEALNLNSMKNHCIQRTTILSGDSRLAYMTKYLYILFYNYISIILSYSNLLVIDILNLPYYKVWSQNIQLIKKCAPQKYKCSVIPKYL